MTDMAADQLQSADPADWPVAAGWQPLVDEFFGGPIGRHLLGFLSERLAAGATIFPPQPLRALELTPPEQVRVVILGQDPYHGAGQAQGLAFSVAAGQRKLPPSLRNVLHEVATDTGAASICRDDLSAWAQQGVLLLNSVLSVEDGAPQSHAGRGWEALTDALLARVAEQVEPVVFMLWGAAAQRKRGLIEPHAVDASGPDLRSAQQSTQRSAHKVLLANHPSPLAARRAPRPFIGCRHFSQANAFLAAQRPGAPVIRW